MSVKFQNTDNHPSKPSGLGRLQNIDPNDATALQNLASDPSHHVWVSASAGTGKTKVLTDRVLRLMLPGLEREATAPDRILCITYTKAAAAEMAARIQKTLSDWVELSDEDLRKNLVGLCDMAIDDAVLHHARQLFATVVDEGSRLKIMTIHAFCESVLKRFPLEAGLSPDFEIISERQAREMIEAIMGRVMANHETLQDNHLFEDALHLLSAHLNEEQFTELMGKIINDRADFHHFVQSYETVQDAFKAIYQSLGFDQDVLPDPEDIKRDFLKSINPDLYDRLFDGVVTSSKKTSQDTAYRLQQTAKHLKSQSFDRAYLALSELFLTSGGTIRKNLATKDIAENYPALFDALELEKTRFADHLEHYKALMQAQFTRAVLIIGYLIIREFEQEKQHHAYLDFDDLIDRTIRLLTTSDQALWVLYKMDGGIDHILLDEAQDTSLDQWRIIRAITDEFFDGLGRDDRPEGRTVFVVGDEKQSIYSFQKADPAQFKQQRDYYKNRLEAMGAELVRVPMNKSFRSTGTVLSTVDTVFANPLNKDGVTLDMEDEIRHFIHREGHAGHIELWPFAMNQASTRTPWELPTFVREQHNAKQRLATTIAAEIRGWLDNEEILASQGRPIQPRDIMILLRARGTFMGMIVKALKQYNLPVAGVDRLTLPETLIVQDLIAMAQFALLPIDDLTLATILKTPFIGLDEDSLMQLGLSRVHHKTTLWSVLRNSEDHKDIIAYLDMLRRYARENRAYDFFAKLIYTPCPADNQHYPTGLSALTARLGEEILDPLYEFLSLCLDFEQNHGSHLQKFVHWFEDEQDSVKREAEGDEIDQIRIMTAHGSKGLQAPIIFLADAYSYKKESGRNRSVLFWEPDPHNPFVQIPTYVPRNEFQNTRSENLKEAIKKRDDEEYRRLLYVALTRAEDRLYITGTGKRTDKQNSKEETKSWYALIQQIATPDNGFEQEPFAPAREDDAREAPYWSSRVKHVLRSVQIAEPINKIKKSGDQTTSDSNSDQEQSIPTWALTRPPEEPKPVRPLSASEPVAEPAMSSPFARAQDNSRRFLRGTILHKLLQFLPDIEPDKRETLAKDFIQSQWRAASQDGKGLRAETCQAWVDEIMGVLNHPDFAPVFGPNSRAEVPLAGLLQNQKNTDYFVLSAQIDRLVIRDHEILIVDYKTNRPAPDKVDEVPTAYRRQMALYAQALEAIYPDRTIKCALLWTEKCNLMILEPHHLDPYRVAT